MTGRPDGRCTQTAGLSPVGPEEGNTLIGELKRIVNSIRIVNVLPVAGMPDPNIDPAAFVAALIARHRATFGAARMLDGDPVTETVTETVTDEKPADEKPAEKKPAGPYKTFETQADFDAALRSRLDRQSHAAKTEQARLQSEIDALKGPSDEITARANNRVVRAEARMVATGPGGLGVRPEQLDRLLRLAQDDLTGVPVDADGDVDVPALRSALERVLAEFPEFKGTARRVAPPSVDGTLDTGPAVPFTRAQIESMSGADVRKNLTEINRQIKAGLVK